MQSHRKQKDIITLQINPRKTRWIFNLFEDLTTTVANISTWYDSHYLDFVVCTVITKETA